MAVSLVAAAFIVPCASFAEGKKKSDLVATIMKAEELYAAGERDKARKHYLKYIRGMRKWKQWDVAVGALRQCLERYPGDIAFREELARTYLMAGRLDEATDAYLVLRAEATGAKAKEYADQWLEVLTRQGRIREGVTAFNRLLDEIEADASLSMAEKLEEIARLERAHMELLDRSGLIVERRADLGRRLAKNPDSVLMRNLLGDFYLGRDQDALALSEHLLAATLGDRGDHIVAQIDRLERAKRAGEAQRYIYAFLEHFPCHPKVFHVVDLLIQLNTHRDSNRFYDPVLTAAYRASADVCARVLAAPDAPDHLRAEARIRQVGYRALVRRGDLEVWRDARDQYAALLEDASLPEGVRRRLYNHIIEIEIERLGNLEAAYRTTEALAREFPSKPTMLRMADAATWLSPPPAPDALSDFVENHPDDHECRKRLAMWLWSAGRKDAARRVAAAAPENILDGWVKEGQPWAKP